MALALCTAFTSLGKTPGISEKTCLSSTPCAYVHWRQSPFRFETRIFDWFQCLIGKNTNITASGSTQNNKCMLVVCLVTPGLVWPRNKVIVLGLLQVELLSRLLTPALAWWRGTTGWKKRSTGESLGEVWTPCPTSGIYLQALKWDLYMTNLVIPGSMCWEGR